MRLKFLIKHNAGALIFGILFIIVFSPNLFFQKIYSDDASYVSHALTLGLDGDLDYTNEPVDEFSKNKLMPRHAIGSGILAAPFVAIFSVIDRVVGHPIIKDHNNYFGSWSLFGFVFSVNLLFFLGIYFYIKSFQLLEILNRNYWLIILFIFSSTIPYFVLIRYIFSHGFEFFTVAILFWCIVNIYVKVEKSESALWNLCLFGISLIKI